MGILHATLIAVALGGLVLAVLLDLKQARRVDRLWRDHLRRISESCEDCLT